MNDSFPLDFSALRKDTVIEQEKIERIYRVKRSENPDAYRLAQLRLMKEIESHRSDLLVRTHGATLRIMTDKEADDHTWEQGKRAVSALTRSATRRASILREGFSDAERRVAESRDSHLTGIALITRKALARAERELLLGAKPDGDESR